MKKTRIADEKTTLSQVIMIHKNLLESDKEGRVGPR
jgi:hypothetical protein